MAINDDIRNAIEKHLSHEVGAALKERLAQADKDAAEMIRLGHENTRLVQENAELKHKVSKFDAIEKKIGELHDQELRTRQALTDQAIVTLREQHATERVKDMKDIVLAVFANAKFKYMVSEGGVLPMAAGAPGSYPSSQAFSRTATGEGEGMVPPAPGKVP